MRKKKNKRNRCKRQKTVINNTRIHAKKRCVQRYRFYPTETDLIEMEYLIRSGQVYCYKKLTNTRVEAVFSWGKYNGILHVIYSKSIGKIVTFLPLKNKTIRYVEKFYKEKQNSSKEE